MGGEKKGRGKELLIIIVSFCFCGGDHCLLNPIVHDDVIFIENDVIICYR